MAIEQTNSTPRSIDIDSFNQHGHDFWQADGPYRTLHHINPARLQFIERYVTLQNKSVIDVGCGGGVLSEALAMKGAKVRGIDLSDSMIKAAKAHAPLSATNLDYRCISTDECVANNESYDVVTCMEMLEHVADPGAILRDISALLKDDGYVFLSTVNRNVQSYLAAIVAAEYLIGLLPRGTHQHSWFIKPHELVNMCEHANLRVVALCGMDYHPLLKTAFLSRNLEVNYLLVAQKQTREQ